MVAYLARYLPFAQHFLAKPESSRCSSVCVLLLPHFGHTHAQQSMGKPLKSVHASELKLFTVIAVVILTVFIALWLSPHALQDTALSSHGFSSLPIYARALGAFSLACLLKDMVADGVAEQFCEGSTTRLSEAAMLRKVRWRGQFITLLMSVIFHGDLSFSMMDMRVTMLTLALSLMCTLIHLQRYDRVQLGWAGSIFNTEKSWSIFITTYSIGLVGLPVSHIFLRSVLVKGPEWTGLDMAWMCLLIGWQLVSVVPLLSAMHECFRHCCRSYLQYVWSSLPDYFPVRQGMLLFMSLAGLMMLALQVMLVTAVVQYHDEPPDMLSHAVHVFVNQTFIVVMVVLPNVASSGIYQVLVQQSKRLAASDKSMRMLRWVSHEARAPAQVTLLAIQAAQDSAASLRQILGVADLLDEQPQRVPLLTAGSCGSVAGAAANNQTNTSEQGTNPPIAPTFAHQLSWGSVSQRALDAAQPATTTHDAYSSSSSSKNAADMHVRIIADELNAALASTGQLVEVLSSSMEYARLLSEQFGLESLPLRAMDTPVDILHELQQLCMTSKAACTATGGNLLCAIRWQADKSEWREWRNTPVISDSLAELAVQHLPDTNPLDLEPAVASATVLVDLRRVQECVLHCVSNSLKYRQIQEDALDVPPVNLIVLVELARSMPGMPPQVQLRPDQQLLHVEVTDNGRGMDATELSYLFQAFSRLRRHDVERGAGLGLAITSDWVQSQGGLMQARSAGQNLGSTMSMWIPVRSQPGCASNSGSANPDESTGSGVAADVQPPSPSPSPTDMLSLPDPALRAVLERVIPAQSVVSKPSVGSTPPLIRGVSDASDTSGNVRDTGTSANAGEALRGSKWMLIVDDSAGIRRALSRTLQKAFPTVEIVLAENGAQALERTVEAWDAGSPPAIIITDAQMPVMTGYESVSAMRAHGVSCTILGVTGNALPQDLQQFLDSGVDQVLCKPVDRNRLIQCVAKAMEAQPVHHADSFTRSASFNIRGMQRVVPLGSVDDLSRVTTGTSLRRGPSSHTSPTQA